MVTQRKVLGFVASQTAKGRTVSAGEVREEFWLSLSLDAACGHLRRLWRERLIEPASARPPRFRFRLEPGEVLLALRFRVTPRGRERLRWYERQDKDGGDSLF